MARGEVSLWRIAKHTLDFSADDLSGRGAELTGRRWNSKGYAGVYTSRSISLAVLETLVHLGDNVPICNAFVIRVRVPPAVWRLREKVGLDNLDVTWFAEPPGLSSIRLGDEWIAAMQSPLLMVPSVIVPEESNVLINPAHPAAATIKASPVRQFVFDARLKFDDQVRP